MLSLPTAVVYISPTILLSFTYNPDPAIRVGFDIVTCDVAVHELASDTVTVYVPADKSVAVAVV